MKTIRDIIEKLDEKFKPEIIQLMLSSKKVYKIDEKLLKQFLKTEIQELLEGLKGEEKHQHCPGCLCGYCSEPVGYNQRESELRDDIDKIINPDEPPDEPEEFEGLDTGGLTD